MNNLIAYFSAEYGLNETLPIYSGGLGILAGDFIKTAGEVDASLVAVGILYRRGYFEQRILEDGSQQACYPQLNPVALGVIPAVNSLGDPLIIEVPIKDREVFLQIWQVKVGTTDLYLMDADMDRNRPLDRKLTESLYGGSLETRLSQEIILGIGGVKVLRALGLNPTVWHMNEGHAALLALERIREYTSRSISFPTALELVRSNTLFTTHTPVPAGHDVYERELISKYLGRFTGDLGISLDQLFELGRVRDQFNLTRFAVHTSGITNGVSKLHARTTQELMHTWTPDIPVQDIPVKAVTNGVHIPSWLSPELAGLYEKFLPGWESRIADGDLGLNVQRIPDSDLWNAHQRSKQKMLQAFKIAVPPETMIIGFARRFATYKRALLIFQDEQRFSRLLTSVNRPVCIIFAGKAHPADRAGQGFIRKIVEYAQKEPFKHRVFFVENHDIRCAKLLVQGVDLWLNTPLKPLEASGTSGQKAGINGVLNCSIRDGWWDEGYNSANGWAIDSAEGWDLAAEQRDAIESANLYNVLEQAIIPLYYDTNLLGYSEQWVRRMKESIISITQAFSTNRMFNEYLHYFYTPLHQRGRQFRNNNYEAAQRVADYKQFIQRNWYRVEVQQLDVKANQNGTIQVVARIYLGAIWHRDVKIEAVGSDGCGGIWKYPLALTKDLGKGIYEYTLQYPNRVEHWWAAKPNVRAIPISPEFVNDFELELTRWGINQWR